MKKLITLVVAAAGTLSASAQAPQIKYSPDSLLSRWVLDINVIGGFNNQMFTTPNTAANYTNGLNMNTGELKYKNGSALGADAQLGVFFGKKRHFGIGAGFMYLAQQGDAVLDKYHVEYKSTDFQGNTFRQAVTGNNVVENIQTTNLNIPVMLKYKNRFSKRWGFTADAGVLVNMQMRNSYTTHATFDNEAIYQFAPKEGGGTVAVYDNSPTPSANDWLITKAEFLRNNPDGNMAAYFNAKRALGFNVGLGLPATSTKGNVSYTTGSIGFMLQPSFNYFLSDNVALNFGAYYLYQPMHNNATTGYKLTDGTGGYSSVMNNVTEVANHSYGLNLGARFFVFKMKDRDHDGVPDKKDKCPDVAGVAKFQGCPDTDGDGIPDNEDSCVKIAGLAQFHGCPDTDGDGIPDREDACPYNAGPVALHGCPDRDGDGIIDKEDTCPDVFGLAKYHGCPDTDGDGIPDNEDKCPTVPGPASNYGCPLDTVKPVIEPTKEEADISRPILFETNTSNIHATSHHLLDEAAAELKENPGLYISIDGHADTTGPEAHNRVLSNERANSVKRELMKRGISAKRLRTHGHGSRIPTATNITIEGRHENRRAVMELVPTKK